jgi:serine/threonine-protein kinase
MSDETRVEQLLDEIFDSGRTPEEVCADCPELLAEVHQRRRQMRLMEAQLEVLFPTPAPTRDANTPVRFTPAPEMPHIPGYEVQAELGRGGMGIVYKARHLRLKRIVALKMLLAGIYATKDERQRFFREAEAVAALRHANIVQVYDMGEHDGRPYYTMELVEGGNLQAKVEGKPQPATWSASLTATLADAVHIAHQSGIIHRDLKPANILLQGKQSADYADSTDKSTLRLSDSVKSVKSADDYFPKITDFGLARRLEGEKGLTLSGVLVGTPSYMAPEQARGQKSAIGPATDVYALGAILYELLTGRPPFCAETATATLRQVETDEPVPPGRLNPAVPRDLETICLKCLQKEPAHRYSSAAALADDLRRFERGEPIMARPPGALERAAKWTRRRPTTAALLAASVLMLAGITAVSVWYAGDRAQRRAEAKSRGRVADAALDQAEERLKDLRAKLDDAPQAWNLLSDIDHWQSMVEQARQDWQRAAAAVGDETLTEEKTWARIQAVEAAVEHEEAAYELAKELDDIAVDAFAFSDVNQSQQRKAIARYERFFTKHDLDVREANRTGFASAVRSSSIRFALISALDNWALLAAIIKRNERIYSLPSDARVENAELTAAFSKDQQFGRLLELARDVDRDPWRERFRQPAAWADRAALSKLADEVEVGRQSPTVLAALGWALYANEVDPTALFDRALLEHPRDFWLTRHALSRRGSDPGAAIGLAHSAIAVRPRDAMVYCTLSWCLGQRGNWQAALAAAERAIKSDLDAPHGYVVRGLARREMKNLPEAVADFQRAIKLDPAQAWSRYNLGRVYQQLGRYAEAEQAYLGAIQVQPSAYGSYQFLAQLQATCPDDKVRDGKRAVEYATTACERSRWKDPSCLDVLAAAYAEAGQFDEAVRYQTRALDDPALKGDFRTAAKERLELYKQKKPFREKGP